MSGERILVVDDEPQMRRALRNALTAHGYEVTVAEDGATALEAIATWAPDAIVLDLVMPGIDGFEVLRGIKSSPEIQHTPVIMLTVKTQSADIVEGLREGAELYLPKPFHPKELVSLVKRVLEAQDASF